MTADDTPGPESPDTAARCEAGELTSTGRPAVDGAGQNTADAADRRARVALTLAAEPGDQAIGRLLARHGAVEALERVRAGHVPGADRRVDGYRARLARVDPEETLAAATERGIQLICPGESGWPSQLDALGDRRPTALWVRGAVPVRAVAVRSVAVVGCRQATAYGDHVAAEFGLGLAERCWCVVSGGAFGIDAGAHRGALLAGPTIAVLANGVDIAYPSAHTALLERIAACGALVGELPPGTRPTRYRFLERNRVIAALSRGAVVVEAAFRSGALRTAHETVALGRPVMAVPGPVTSAQSVGTHSLLRDGALLVTNAAEVVEHLALIGEELAPSQGGSGRAADRLGRDLRRVLDGVPADRAATLDEVACAVAVTPGEPIGTGEVLAALSALAASGWVVREGMGWRAGRAASAG